MAKDLPYLDFHRHTPPAAPDEFALLNLFPEDAGKYDESAESMAFSIGLHPWFVSGDDDDKIAVVRKLAAMPRVLAVGEAGLDRLKGPDLETQTRVFETQAQIAADLGKPMVLHCVRAHQEVVALRKKLRPARDWVIHGFCSNENIAAACLDAGLKLSFGAALLKNERLADRVFREIPADRLFLETDDMGPSIAEVFARAAEIRGVRVDDMKKITIENFEKTLGFNIHAKHS